MEYDNITPDLYTIHFIDTVSDHVCTSYSFLRMTVIIVISKVFVRHIDMVYLVSCHPMTEE